MGSRAASEERRTSNPAAERVGLASAVPTGGTQYSNFPLKIRLNTGKKKGTTSGLTSSSQVE